MATQSRRSPARQVAATALVVGGVAAAMAWKHAQPADRELLHVQASELDAHATEAVELFRLGALDRTPLAFHRMHATQVRRLVGSLRDELGKQPVEPALASDSKRLQALAEQLDDELARPLEPRGGRVALARRVEGLKALATRTHAAEESLAEPGA